MAYDFAVHTSSHQGQHANFGRDGNFPSANFNKHSIDEHFSFRKGLPSIAAV